MKASEIQPGKTYSCVGDNGILKNRLVLAVDSQPFIPEMDRKVYYMCNESKFCGSLKLSLFARQAKGEVP